MERASHEIIASGDVSIQRFGLSPEIPEHNFPGFLPPCDRDDRREGFSSGTGFRHPG